MSSVQLPEQIVGKWIFLRRLQNRSDTTCLMRSNFNCQPESGSEAVLFITANTGYQVFINGRLAGAGPRAHQCPGTSYIDLLEIGYLLEPGNNVIVVRVTCDADPVRGDSSRVPGLWCQIQCGARTVAATGGDWRIFCSEAFSAPRARVGQGRRRSCFTDFRRIPADWDQLSCRNIGEWEVPDLLTPPGAPGAKLELHPVPPGAISPNHMDFTAAKSGFISRYPGCSAFTFPADMHGTGAAVSYIFTEEPKQTAFKLFSDTPFKFFCNGKKVFEGDFARGDAGTLDLTVGWNRLVVFAPVCPGAMGFMLLFDDATPGGGPLSDMLDSAPPGWCVGSVPRLPYADCTPAVRVEALTELQIRSFDLASVSDVWDLLDNCSFTASDGRHDVFSERFVVLLRIAGLHYGFAKVRINASEGDIVDLIVGVEPGMTELFPVCADGNDREVMTCVCRQGENEIVMPFPADCGCVLLHVRRAKAGVSVVSASFDELCRNFNRECLFSSSDDFLNRVWQTGRSALFRSAAAFAPADGAVGHDSFLLDAFFESANVAAVFGDSEYITARLRQFAEAQLEDGSIPALTSGLCGTSQLIHLFFFSSWVLYNYRFTSNLVEMRSLVPKLDLVRRFMESLLDDSGELVDVEKARKRISGGSNIFGYCRVPVVINALFCRFMLSASELYDLVERPSEAKQCRRLVRSVSAKIETLFFDPETGLFADDPIDPAQDTEFSLYGNFFPALAGIKTGECFEKFVNTFFDFKTGAAKTREAESPYFHCVFMEMLFALGQREWAFRHFRKYWGDRMDFENGLWRDPVTGIVSSTAFSGGMALAPNVFLIREIVGVRIAEPGHSVIYFNPAYTLVDRAEAAIPTVQGRIHISWERQKDGALEVNIYSSHPLKVMPEIPAELLKRSMFRLSESVLLVKAGAEKEENEEA